jgi:hypothetical protein
MAEFLGGIVCGGIFKLMECLYGCVEGAMANQDLCDGLGTRVRVIEGALRALETAPLRPSAIAAPLAQLQTTLQSAIMLVKEQCQMGRLLLFINGSNIRSRFDEIHRRLSQCQIDLAIPFEVETRNALAKIIDAQQDTAAQIAALAESLKNNHPAQI